LDCVDWPGRNARIIEFSFHGFSFFRTFIKESCIMASYNRVVLIGNLTRDVEIRHTATSRMAVCQNAIAVNDRRKNAAGEWVDETTFVDVTFFGRMAELVSEYLTKGSPIFIEGRLKLDTWEKDGQKRSKLYVIAERMQFLSGKQEGGAGRPGGNASTGNGGNRPQLQNPNDGNRQEDHHSSEIHEEPLYHGDEMPF
jgi:single-strand DNA-binding protein